MANINKSPIIQRVIEVLGIQAAKEGVPNVTADKIQPVVEVTPITNAVYHREWTTTLDSSAILTTPSTDTNFYITYAQLAITKDVACDNVLASIYATINGVIVNILCIPTQTLTAGSHSVQLSFPKPIKLDKNTLVRISGAFTVGTMTKEGIIGGYFL